MKIMILRLSLLICFLIQISIYGQSVPVSICGGDDREESIDKAVGRIWIDGLPEPSGMAFIF